jgi:DNA replication and repair protein RecF
MYLTSLVLKDFRNYTSRYFEFGKKITLITGGNGLGKTNILEACYLLATGRSFRAHKVEEMINFGKEISRIGGEVESGSGGEGQNTTNLEVVLTRGEVGGRRVAKRRFRLEGAAKRAADFTGKLVAVLFRPEDLEIVTGSPPHRRTFMDGVLIQVDREYRRSLMAYEKALYRRNRILDAIRDEGISRTQLTFWDQMLIKHGQILTERRGKFLDYINDRKIEIDSYKIKYEGSMISEQRLAKYAEQEVAAGYTLVGPHKDDFRIETNSKIQESRDLMLYGSRGEQRLGVLWLKLAELAYVTEKTGDKPVLLLDDIFSELDEEHKSVVLKIIPEQQTIITATEAEFAKAEEEIKSIEL